MREREWNVKKGWWGVNYIPRLIIYSNLTAHDRVQMRVCLGKSGLAGGWGGVG